MEDVLNMLRECEYLSENYESDHYGECTKEDIQQAGYECLYFRKLADYLETMMESGKYSEKDMAENMQIFYDKMYSDFKKNCYKTIQTKKKATLLKNRAFYTVYGVLEDALSSV